MGNIASVIGATFDSDAVEPQTARSVLPPGNYTVEITDAELKPTKRGDGQYISIEHSIIDPVEHAGRKVWSNINIVNASPKAEEIGRAQLSALCRAAGIKQLSDTDELMGRIIRAEIKIKPANGEFPEQNTVASYSLAGVPTPTPTAANRPAMDKPAAKAQGGAPWQKK